MVPRPRLQAILQDPDLVILQQQFEIIRGGEKAIDRAACLRRWLRHRGCRESDQNENRGPVKS